MTNEPVIAGYTVTAAVIIILNLVVALDVWEPTAEQVSAITAAAVLIVSFIAAFLTRRVVTPVRSLPALPPPPPQA